jgi:hypothetical protein
MSEPINFEQTPFGGTADFAENPEHRCPCVLILDISGSMGGQPIAELNDGLRTFRQELDSDDLTLKRVEIAQVLFGPIQATDFEGAATWGGVVAPFRIDVDELSSAWVSVSRPRAGVEHGTEASAGQ